MRARRGSKKTKRKKETEMQKIKVTLTEATPLIMHANNIDWSDKMEAWQAVPANKKVSKAGDDRTPPWRWIGCLNFDNPTKGCITIPSEYIMKSVMEAAASVPTGKGRNTFKSQSQSGMICEDFHWPLRVKGKTIAMADVNACMKLSTFAEQNDAVEKLGFSLFTKAVTVNQKRHIRVRPRFDNWSVSGSITVTDTTITPQVLRDIFEIAGRFKGLGDWRPSAPKKPGNFGMFTAEITMA
jgi:hypothetical protein